jgi:hypothetical protein
MRLAFVAFWGGLFLAFGIAAIGFSVAWTIVQSNRAQGLSDLTGVWAPAAVALLFVLLPPPLLWSACMRSRLIVDAQAITLVDSRTRTRIPWQDIGWFDSSNGMVVHTRGGQVPVPGFGPEWLEGKQVHSSEVERLTARLNEYAAGFLYAQSQVQHTPESASPNRARVYVAVLLGAAVSGAFHLLATSHRW